MSEERKYYQGNELPARGNDAQMASFHLNPAHSISPPPPLSIYSSFHSDVEIQFPLRLSLQEVLPDWVGTSMAGC